MRSRRRVDARRAAALLLHRHDELFECLDRRRLRQRVEHEVTDFAAREMQRRTRGALLDAFAAARTSWTDRLRPLTTADFARSARHPRLDQPMRLIDHCVFVAEHDDHHLGRILQLLGGR